MLKLYGPRLPNWTIRQVPIPAAAKRKFEPNTNNQLINLLGSSMILFYNAGPPSIRHLQNPVRMMYKYDFGRRGK